METNRRSTVWPILCILILAAHSTALSEIIYVDDDGSADFDTIQAAIDAAFDGDVVLVAPGTYAGDGNRDIDFGGKAITVKSEAGPESCIIQCGGRYRVYGPPQSIEPEYHRGFHFHSHEDANSIVQGFTVTQGYMEREAGGAFYCVESSPIIRDCIITGNTARFGGGIAAYKSNIRVENCIITENIASFVPQNLDYIFDVAGESGGGMDIGRGNARILNCLVVANYARGGGGGIFCQQGGHEITNCTITGNRTGHTRVGGGIWFGSPRGVSPSGNTAYLRNSIAWGNAAGLFGNDIAVRHSSPILGVMWLEVEHSLMGDDPNDLYDPYERIRGHWITGDPQFVVPGRWDPNGTPDKLNDDFWVDGDYHLKSQAGRWDPVSQSWVIDDAISPCIDAGDPNSPIGLEPFPNGGQINMGAYGGTGEASKSYFGEPVCETVIAGDINGDCRVDFRDLQIMAGHWLQSQSE